MSFEPRKSWKLESFDQWIKVAFLVIFRLDVTLLAPGPRGAARRSKNVVTASDQFLRSSAVIIAETRHNEGHSDKNYTKINCTNTN